MRRTIKRVAFLTCLGIGLLGLSPAALANWCAAPINPPPDPPEEPDQRCEPPCKCTGSPCYLGSGVYVTSVTDLQVKTAAGFPLVASRRYLSSQLFDGPMGVGWMPNVLSRLSYATYQFAAGVYQKRAYVLLPDGSRLKFTENANGTYTPALGRYDTLIKNGDGSFDLTIQHSRSRLHFGGTGYLTAMTDDYQNTLSFTNGPTGSRVQQVTDLAGSGRYLTITWGADGRISAIGDSTGRLVQYSYDAHGALTSMTDPANRTTTYGYDTGRFGPLLAQITDNWDRVVSDVTYEAGTDRVLTYTEQGERYTLAYHFLGYPNWVGKRADSFPPGQWYTFAFDPSNGLVTDNYNLVVNQHTDFYPDGSVKEIVDRAGIHTFFTYDVNGNVATVTRNKNTQNLNSIRFDYAYDPLFPGKVTSISPKNPADGTPNLDWLKWNYDYYQLGSNAPGALWKVRRNGAAGALATYTYDTRGRETQFITGGGGSTDYTYDAQGNLTTVTLSANNDGGTRPHIIYGYDPLGRVTSVTDPLGKQTSYTYDALDRVTSVTLPTISTTPGSFMTTYSHDNFDGVSGLVFTQATDPNGIAAKQGFDQYGQLIKAVDGLSHATTWTYLRGLVASTTDANGYTTTYGYDAANRLTKTTFADGTAETYTYTYDELLGTVTRGGQQIKYQYDAYKRLQYKSNGYMPSQNFAFTYVGQKLTQVAEYYNAQLQETDSFGYDSQLRVNKITTPRGVIDYTYDSSDRATSYTVEGSPAVTTNYAYYLDGSLKTITWHAMTAPNTFTYLYDLAGRQTKLTFPTGQHRDYSYDEQGRVLSIANKTSSNANLATYAYGYDFNYTTGNTHDRKGQRVSLTATVPSMSTYNGLTKYEYDSLYELTKRTLPGGGSTSWTYDAIGNRLTAGSAVYGYQKIAPNPNNWQRLLNDGISGHTWTYDGRGNTATQAGGQNLTFGWDWRNQLASISGTVNATYTYDFQGRRSTKTVNGSSTSYVYDGLNIVQEKTGDSLAVAADYLFGPGMDEPLAMKRGGTVYYYVVDGLGSVRLVTDTSNNAVTTVRDKYQWDAWGERLGATSDPVVNPFGYTAREIGDAKDLFYRARYYAPGVGRFISEERVPTDFSLYGYVENRPTHARDPLGLQSFPVIGAPGFNPVLVGPWFSFQPGPYGGFYYYGTWGGPNWAGGQWVPGGSENLPGWAAPPIDPQDACYQQHDDCYAGCRSRPNPCPGSSENSPCGCQRGCDRQLVDCLRHVPRGQRGGLGHYFGAVAWFTFSGHMPCL